MDTNFSERELELMQMRRDALERASGQQVQSAPQAAPERKPGISSRSVVQSANAPITQTEPSATNPDIGQLIQNVGDAIPGMAKNVAIPAVGTGILAGLAHLLLGGKTDSTGDAKAGERREPLMDVSRKGPQEPTFAPEPQFAPGPVAPTTPVEPKPLSPLEQEALREKQLKNQRLELAIQADKEKAERAKADHEAKQAQNAVKAKQAAGGSITESEGKMLAASETAKISKAIEADQKVQQTNASLKQANAAVAPAVVDAASKTPVAPTVEGAAQKTAVAQFTRDANGKIQWPQGMTPAAQAGAEGFMTQFPELAKQLEAEGRFGILGAGKGDNNLYNSYGKDFAKTLRNEVNQGQMVGTYGNYKDVVNPAIGQIPPETPVGKQLTELRAKQPEGGTHGPLGQGAAVKEGKLITAKNALNPALKGGAAAALLMSIADAANAKEAARNVGEALLPWGMTPTEVESGKLTAKQLKAFEEAKKLGSPYRSVPPPR